MPQKVLKKICECRNCGNEAEMTITCTLEPEDAAETKGQATASPSGKEKIQGHAVCSQCGAEADMWLDF